LLLAALSPDDVLAIEWYPEAILAMAALLTAIAGVMTAWGALRRHGKNVKQTAEEECLVRLRAARAEAESVAQELHDLKMRTHR
jgi:hypothetical protein